jgi:putative protease
MTANRLELVCPAGTPAALRAAVEAGADAVYLGFRDETNARNFPGLNFSPEEAGDGLAYAHARGCKVFVAINTFPRAGSPQPWHDAVDHAANMGADAVILADIGLLDYAARRHPGLRRHLSVQASASNPEAIRFYHEAFGVKRVVLPRVLTLDEIARLNADIPVETEVFAFGGMCVMAEGRCSLSSYATGQSPNVNGVCSPASHVRYEHRGDELVSRLGDFTINAFAAGEPAGYPTLCKGRFVTGGCASYLFEDPISQNRGPAARPGLCRADRRRVPARDRRGGPGRGARPTRSHGAYRRWARHGGRLPESLAMTAKPREDARLTLGPILFNWPADEKRDFYLRIADEAPVDTVCLGEVVCSKRTPFFTPHLREVIERLERAGKEAVLSTLALVMTERELQDLRAAAQAEDLLIEANDLGCAALLRGKAHAIGPFVNVYNEGTLRYLAARGAVRITLPFELPGRAIEALARSAEGAEVEVQVFGRIPLAISARCYHARAQGLHKNTCQYVCEADRDGMDLETLDGQPFLAVNGTQTLSYGIGNLAGELETLRAMGVGRFRLSSHAIDMVAVAAIFRALLDRRLNTGGAWDRLSALAAFAPFSNGFYHGVEGAQLTPPDTRQAQ